MLASLVTSPTLQLPRLYLDDMNEKQPPDIVLLEDDQQKPFCFHMTDSLLSFLES